ncbi:Uncharacterised protein [Buttiauxella agrestis]|uniref:Uncharacterized protein n=1 Tax=Buttiauxella agrestis TaxID=82977 RepID=A0A381KNR7_9ENTR|nr:Uncharacterised protein [Buttiauxella agrestis]SUY92949.1 Uncharacterised protein [Buttiauxella agrestis]
MIEGESKIYCYLSASLLTVVEQDRDFMAGIT